MSMALDDLTRECLKLLRTHPPLMSDRAFFRRARVRVARLLAGGIDDSLWPDMPDDERRAVCLMYRQIQNIRGMP